MGALGRLFGNLGWAFIAVDAIFPAALLLLFVEISKPLINSPSVRLFIAWSTLLISFAPRSFFGLGYDSLIAPLLVTRTPHPEISVVFLLVGVLATGHALKDNIGRTALIFCGFASAINTYTYYYYTVAWGITLALLFCGALVWRNRPMAIRTAWLGFITGLLSIPFAIVAVKSSAESSGGSFVARLGVATHQPNLPAMLIAVVGFVAVLTFGRSLFERDAGYASIGLLLLAVVAGFFGMNVQIVSGLAVASEHFVSRLIQPLGWFLLTCCLGWLVEKDHRVRSRHVERVAMIAVAALIGTAGVRQVYAGVGVARYHDTHNSKIELVQWAATHIPPETVVGTCEPELILLFPAITRSFTYVPSGLRTAMPRIEIIARFLELASLLGYSGEDIARIVNAPAHWPDPKPEIAQDLNISADEAAGLVAEYSRYQGKDISPTNRLDYVVIKAGQAVPVGIRRRFHGARVVHENQEYGLIECGPRSQQAE